MMKIEIQEFYDCNKMADALEIIAVQVRHGMAKGTSPAFKITSDEE